MKTILSAIVVCVFCVGHVHGQKYNETIDWVTESNTTNVAMLEECVSTLRNGGMFITRGDWAFDYSDLGFDWYCSNNDTLTVSYCTGPSRDCDGLRVRFDAGLGQVRVEHAHDGKVELLKTFDRDRKKFVGRQNIQMRYYFDSLSVSINGFERETALISMKVPRRPVLPQPGPPADKVNFRVAIYNAGGDGKIDTVSNLKRLRVGALPSWEMEWQKTRKSDGLVGE